MSLSNMNPAQQARALGLVVGDTIEGVHNGCTARLTHKSAGVAPLDCPVKTGRKEPMKTERLEIGGTLVFDSTKYETSAYNDACFEFVEHATDHWCSDIETSISIDAAMARKIIDALNQHFEF